MREVGKTKATFAITIPTGTKSQASGTEHTAVSAAFSMRTFLDLINQKWKTGERSRLMPDQQRGSFEWSQFLIRNRTPI
jgi:hypothetical protein